MYRPIISTNDPQIKSFRKFLDSLKPGDFLFEPFEPNSGVLLEVKDIEEPQGERYSCRAQLLAEKNTHHYPLSLAGNYDYLIFFRTTWERIKKVDPNDLVLYVHFKFKNLKFMELLEGTTICTDR